MSIALRRFYVIVDVIENDLLFRVVGDIGVSEIFTLVGKASRIGGNPYLIYGDTVCRVSGENGFDNLTITVAQIVSGVI